MKGTEKQIAWATDIKVNIAKIIDALVAELEQCAANPRFASMMAQFDEKKEAFENQKAAIEACESARDLIDCYAGVSDARGFIARCRVHLPQNDIQKRILGK